MEEEEKKKEKREVYDIGQGIHYDLDTFEIIEVEQNKDDKGEN